MNGFLLDEGRGAIAWIAPPTHGARAQPAGVAAVVLLAGATPAATEAFRVTVT